MASDVAQIYALWNEYTAVCHSGDFEGFMDLWIDDGLQMPPNAPQRVGKAQIREAMKPSFDHYFMCNMIINTEEVRILGDRAYSHGTFAFDMVAKKGGETKSLSGKFLDILEKAVDGSWKIAIDCHSLSGPEG